jgi:hypothetical protein
VVDGAIVVVGASVVGAAVVGARVVVGAAVVVGATVVVVVGLPIYHFPFTNTSFDELERGATGEPPVRAEKWAMESSEGKC